MKSISVREIAEAVEGKIIAGDENVKIQSVSINSREIEEGALFVPIIGEKVDAHKFISMALEAGAVATFTSREIEEYIPGKVYIQVEDTVVALQKAAAYYRNQFSVTVIGITGSVGKTTTKEMIASTLETKYKVLKTKGNMNSQIGLPLMMFYIEEDTQIAVIEMGMSEVGEMQRLSAIARPDMAVLTNIGVSHIGQLGSQENIRKEKMNIIDEFQADSPVFVNGNDPLLYEMKGFSENSKSGKMPEESLFDRATREKLSMIQIKTYGTEGEYDFIAENVETEGNGTKFVYRTNGKKEEIRLSVLGMHNVFNATVALAIAEQLGIELAVAKEGLENYQPISMRGQIFENNGMKIIDDTYNASPDSMKSGISVLLELDGVTRRIAILADVLELGEVSCDCHYGVGSFIGEATSNGKKIDMVLTVGKEAKAIAKGVEDKNKEIQTKCFENNGEVIKYIKEIAKSGDGILLKGSRGMHMEEVVEALKNEIC